LAKRHELRAGDWQSIAVRLDEIICAHSGEDAFEEALKLLVAKLAHERGPSGQGFLDDEAHACEQAGELLAQAAEQGLIEPGASLRLRAPELCRCAAALRSVRLLGQDLVGLDAIFEFMVNKAAKGQKGQYFTPRHVVAEVVKMLQPTAGQWVADPACGSGGFLRHALLLAPRCRAWGFDQDARAVRVARVMLAATAKTGAQVMRADSLALAGANSIESLMQPHAPEFRGFDMILTNPPFAGDMGPATGYQLARGKRIERDVLFIERCLSLLRAGGRLAMVLPHNKLGGQAWTYLRKWLLERLQVVAVLGLGRNTFQPHTGQKACVLIGQKRTRPAAPASDEEILFYISERDGKDARGRLQCASDGTVIHDLAEATALVRDRFQQLAGVA
jgi:type I restriction enzyme M protein